MLKGAISGATSYLEAFQIISRYRLWGYFIAPFIICLLLGAGIVTTAWGASDNIGHWLIGFYPWDWGKGTIEKIVSVFGGLFIGAMGFIIFKHLVLALSSPFMSPLSEKVERALSGREGPGTPFSIAQFTKDLIRGITIAIRNIIRELFFTFLLFLLGLFPPLTPFTTVAIFLIQAYYAGFGNMDFLLERHFNVRQSVRFVRKNAGIAIGNGAVFLALFLTVVGFVVVLPLGTVAATRVTMDKL